MALTVTACVFLTSWWEGKVTILQHKFVKEVHHSFFICCVCVCVYVCICMRTMVCTWRLEDSLWESILSFHYVGLGD